MARGNFPHRNHPHGSHPHGNPLHGDAVRHGDGRVSGHGMGSPVVYERFTGLLFAGRRPAVYRKLAALSGAAPGDRVVDAGCGTGYLSRMMAARVAPGGSVLGVDPTASAVAYAREQAPPGCTFVEGIAQELPSTDGSVDVVVSSLALHHIPEQDRPAAVADMRRVLRPGGTVVLADFRPPHNAVLRRLIGHLAAPAMEQDPRGVLAGLLAEAGFEDIRTRELHPWLHVAGGRKSAAP
jgi:SAM-dependent methyltransferase